MQLSVLTENAAGGRFKAEHGLSYYLEHEGFKLLFDTGHSDVFLQNAKQLSINLDQVNTVVLSHGHWDHGDGLRFLKNKMLVCHPDVFMKRYRKQDHSYIGLELTENEIESKFNIVKSTKPYYITETIIFLGTVPRIMPFEAQTTSFVDADDLDDFVPDDSALVFVQNNELIIVTACSHAGICNIIEHAKKTTGINKINSVIGGFHLKEQNEQTKETIAYLNKQDLKQVFPSHCTELPALAAFYDAFKIKQVKTGMTFHF